MVQIISLHKPWGNRSHIQQLQPVGEVTWSQRQPRRVLLQCPHTHLGSFNNLLFADIGL